MPRSREFPRTPAPPSPGQARALKQNTAGNEIPRNPRLSRPRSCPLFSFRLFHEGGWSRGKSERGYPGFLRTVFLSVPFGDLLLPFPSPRSPCPGALIISALCSIHTLPASGRRHPQIPEAALPSWFLVSVPSSRPRSGTRVLQLRRGPWVGPLLPSQLQRQPPPVPGGSRLRARCPPRAP